MITYLLVMILPLAGAYGFFLWVQEWNHEKRVADTFELTERIHELEASLQSVDWYERRPREEFNREWEAVTNDSDVAVKLFRSDGLMVYNSESNDLRIEPRQSLLQGLYHYDLSFQSLSVKKPVFVDGEIKGIYDIRIDRSEWVEGVKNRRIGILALSGVLFLLIYSGVLWMLHRKWNLPLKRLISGMDRFADYQTTVRFPDKKKDELGQLMTHFESMQEQVEAANRETVREQEEKQLMMASFSHDIKTPLTSLQTYAEALQGEGLTEQERKEYLQILAGKSNHLKGLIEDLTTFAKFQSSSYEMERPEVDAEEFFDMLFEGYDEMARARGVLFLKEERIEGTVRMSAREMIRYLDNLMSNALRYTPEGKTIFAAVLGEKEPLPGWVFPEAAEEMFQERKGRALLLVQNEGPAIAEQQLESVLKPFYQGEASRTSDDGKQSGLGLSIAHMIAESHEGEMKLWSVPGRGMIIAMLFNQVHEGEG